MEEKEELLVEPDETTGREEEEASVGGVAGVSTPLGTGPTYPNRHTKKNRRKNPAKAAADSFGGSKIVSKNK